MREILATVTRKGQVTIPAEVRRHLGIKAADQVTFAIDENEGGVRLVATRYPDIRSLRGVAGTLRQSLPWSEMREAAREDRLAPAPPRPSPPPA